jgi:DNA polymerase-4
VDFPKRIAHLDLDCFFVSVERLHDPFLEGKAVAVGGSPDGRGVITSASYEARAFGVHSAMPTGKALRLCPHLILVHSRHHEYGEISDKLYRRFLELAPVVERASIDEMYLDFTGCDSLYNNDLPGFMRTLQQLVRKEFGLPCSIALATTKILAKIAVGTVKPAGVCSVPPGGEETFLAPLPVGAIPGVGKKTEEILLRRGFRRIADLQRLSQEELVRWLGAHGVWFYHVVHGSADSVVAPDQKRKSISREETFAHDLRDIPELEKELFALTEDVCRTLRSYRWKARTVAIKLRYADFRTITRAKSGDPTDDDPVVFGVVRELFHSAYEGHQPLRLVGVHLSQFQEGEQLSLGLESRKPRRDELLRAVDALRERFGDDVIHLGQV